VRFTDKIVAALEPPPDKAEQTFWDPSLPGFGVRVRRSTTNSISRCWRVQYRTHHQQRSESLGDIRKVSLADARAVAKTRFATVQLGRDPGAERDAARRAAMAARNTLGATVERYLEARRGELRRSTYLGAARYLRLYWAPLHGYPLGEIRRQQVASIISDAVRTRGRASARDARKVLSALYSWAMAEGIAESNPVIGTNNPGAGTAPRERVLDGDELRAIWRACEAQDDDYSRILRLLLWTGARRGEIGGLRWDEVDLQTGVVSLSRERTKNKHPFELTLPASALELVRAIPRRDGRPFIFGKSAVAGFSGWSWCKLGLDRHLIEVAGRPIRWHVHDLRRTMATNLGRLGVSPHVIDATLNHVRPVLHRTYVRSSYQREAAQALCLWSEALAAVVEGRKPKVLTLPQRA
jgi:integrase